MKISKKSRYALRLCLDLVIHQQEGCVSLNEIAQRQGVSKKFLEHIVQDLSKAGILKTYRGHMGGYRLARDVEDISLADILRATETSEFLVSCLNPEEFCEKSHRCLSRSVWLGLVQAMDEYCKKVTLQSILSEDKKTHGSPPESPVRFVGDGCRQTKVIGLRTKPLTGNARPSQAT